MKALGALQIALLVSSVTVSCGKRPHIQSSLREIASSANDTLLNDLEKHGELSLNKVIEKRISYGLSDQELANLKENFSAEDIDKLVLNLVDPKCLRGLTPVRWAYLPNVSDSNSVLKKIETVDKQGRIDVIDGTSALESINAPVITLSFTEKLFWPIAKNFEISPAEIPEPASEGSLMLDNIQFKDTSEPWIKGEAEIYAVISYIDKNHTGATEVLELPSVDYANQDYPLRLMSHIWNKNRYQILNITFFEHDSNHSYSELAKAFTIAAAGITQAIVDPTKLTTLAVIAIVSKLSTAVIDALPKAAMTDSDDYLDSVNSVEKYQAGKRAGASGNVTTDLSHFKLKLNDE